MTSAQAGTIAGNEAFLGAQLSSLSDGALVFEEWIVAPDGTLYPRDQYPNSPEYTVTANGAGSDWGDSIGNALATGVQTFSTMFSRLLTGQQGINPATGLPYQYATGSPFGGISGTTMLMIGGVVLVFVLMKGRGGGGGNSERSYARSAPREHHDHEEHRARHRKNPLQIIPGYATNRRRRRYRKNARVKFYGAFGSRAKAESKARAVGGTLRPFKVHGAMRYGVMKRA